MSYGHFINLEDFEFDADSAEEFAVTDERFSYEEGGGKRIYIDTKEGKVAFLKEDEDSGNYRIENKQLENGMLDEIEMGKSYLIDCFINMQTAAGHGMYKEDPYDPDGEKEGAKVKETDTQDYEPHIIDVPITNFAAHVAAKNNGGNEETKELDDGREFYTLSCGRRNMFEVNNLAVCRPYKGEYNPIGDGKFSSALEMAIKKRGTKYGNLIRDMLKLSRGHIRKEFQKEYDNPRAVDFQLQKTADQNLPKPEEYSEGKLALRHEVSGEGSNLRFWKHDPERGDLERFGIDPERVD